MANPKKGTSQARNEFIWGWAFILPTMLGLIILNIYPIFKTIYESFFKTGDFGKGNIFIGFDNYVKLFHDAEVWQALLNTFKYAIVEVPFTAFGTFLLKQAYMGLPKDLEEAARLDGCNIGQTFLFIMAPLTRSSMVALGIFTAVFAYKDLMWPLICNKDVMPLSAALAKMQGQYTNNYPQLMAASLLACIPMIVLYLIFQKQFIEGIATSGGKL